MVQGNKHAGPSHVGAFTKDPAARIASFEAVQKREQERKATSSQSKQNSHKTFGAWGPVYKSQQHFAEMHFC